MHDQEACFDHATPDTPPTAPAPDATPPVQASDLSQPTPAGTPYLRTPALSADGQTLAFVYASDIWLVPSSGGQAERLTSHTNASLHPAFSPDGQQLAFTSFRGGWGDVFVLPLAGGQAERLTLAPSYCEVEDWSADGQHIFYTSRRERQGWAVYRAALAGGTPARVFAEPYEDLGDVVVAPDGQHLVLNVIRQPWWQRGPNPFAPGEIWLLPTRLLAMHEPGSAQPRLLAGPTGPHAYTGLNRWPCWAADGQGVYFVSDRDGNENIWYTALEDGTLHQMTHFTEGRVLCPVAARAAPVLVFERHTAGRPELWRLALDQANASPDPLSISVRADTKYYPAYTASYTRNVDELALAPDGKKLAFIMRGSLFADFADKETDREQRQGPSFRLSDTVARESQVSWAPDSRALVYISDRHGEPEVYHYSFATGQETRLTDSPVPKGAPRCSPDGTWVAYQQGADAIYLLNRQTHETRLFARGNFLLWQAALAWSPDSQWLAFIARDERFFSNVYVQHIDAGEARQITFLSHLTAYRLLWAPNGQFLIFTSAQYRLESQIVRVDLRPPEPPFREVEFARLFEEPARDKPPAKAEPPQPALASDTPANDAPPGELAQEEPAQEEPPAETPNEPTPAAPTSEPGSQDEPPGTPPARPDARGEPQLEIVFAGIERRLSFLTPPQIGAYAFAISPTSKDLLFTAEVADQTSIWSQPLDEPRRGHAARQLVVNAASKYGLQFAPDGKLFYALEDGQIVTRKFPNGNDRTVVWVRGDVTIDFAREKQQLFDEAWRWLRDTFYDAAFGGHDWQALRAQFLPLAHGAQTASEVLTALNLLVGELRTSHLGVYWGGNGGNSTDGYVGLVFEPALLLDEGLLRVAEVVPDSPAAHAPAPPQVGEYLLAVNGTPLTPQTNLDTLLHRTVGRRVVLWLAATPDSSETRAVALRPVDAETYTQLRYRAWVLHNKSYVHRTSNGRLGYVHIDAMSYAAYQQFLTDLDAEVHAKDGVVIDIRYNSGGHIATFLIDVLTRRTVIRSSFRGALATDTYHMSGNRTLNRPTVLVTNEESMSNAEIFSEMYRRLGLGRVVGRPTAGAVLGTVRWGLLNGAYVSLPMLAYHTLDGESLEGTGRPVDSEAAHPLGEWLMGRDQQLDAAVATLLEAPDAAEPG